MRKIALYFIPGILLGILITIFLLSSSSTHVETVFSPGDGTEILDFLDSAQNSIYIEVYILSSETVIEKLILANSKGLDVKVIMEKRMGGKNKEFYSQLKDGGVDVRWASYDFQLTHSKIIIIDKKKVFVGSHNFSNAAIYKNREASVILEGPIINEFLQLFYEDWIKATY